MRLFGGSGTTSVSVLEKLNVASATGRDEYSRRKLPNVVVNPRAHIRDSAVADPLHFTAL